MILETPLVTERLALRTLTVNDATDAYCRWMSDKRVNRFLESRFRSLATKDLAEFITACNANPNILLLGIIIRANDKHIGNIKLGPIDRNHGLGDIGLLIGEPDEWGFGFAREAIKAVSDYALGPLSLHKVTAGCYASHVASRKAFESSGFLVEGIRPKHFRSDGQWEDAILMARIAEAS
jgi:RimJ/RimL family protein N-acetyltransferase